MQLTLFVLGGGGGGIVTVLILKAMVASWHPTGVQYLGGGSVWDVVVQPSPGSCLACGMDTNNSMQGGFFCVCVSARAHVCVFVCVRVRLRVCVRVCVFVFDFVVPMGTFPVGTQQVQSLNGGGSVWDVVEQPGPEGAALSTAQDPDPDPDPESPARRPQFFPLNSFGA